MAKARIFARIDQGIAMEIVPPLPLSDGWKEIMPDDGDLRKLYGYPMGDWVELTGMKPMPQPNWIYADGVFSEPVIESEANV